MLDASGCEYTNVELGKEWFLLGGEGSEARVALSREVEGGATSLPKIFIGGECIGGCAMRRVGRSRRKRRIGRDGEEGEGR